MDGNRDQVRMNDPPVNGDNSPDPRRERRVSTVTHARVRREGLHSYEASILDVSPSGCRMEFVDRPSLRERVWVKFDGLEAMPAIVCWVEGADAGLEFERAIYPAVFDLILRRISAGRR